MKEAIKTLNEIVNIKDYKSYIEDYNKSIDLKKSTKIKLSFAFIMLIISIITGIVIFKKPEFYGMWFLTFNAFISIGLFFNTMNEVETKTKIIGTSLNKQDFIIKEMKSKSLNLEQIKLLEKFILIIKSEVSSEEFEELLLRNEKLSEESTSNAYFYYYLFENYKDIIEEIRQDKDKKIQISKKMNLLIEKNSTIKNSSYV